MNPAPAALRRLSSLVSFLAFLALPAGLSAQPGPNAPAAEAAAGAAAARDDAAAASQPTVAAGAARSQGDRYEVRSELSQLLLQHRSELATILALDPSLLGNRELLAANPEVGSFVAAHPEVLANPDFYLGQFADRRSRSSDTAEALLLGTIFTLIALSLGWLVKTVVEQKRWSRLARTQSEVHNKILDRFGSSEELLAYVRSPAGARFLESAPIPLHADRPAANPALSRVMWSVQVGVVLAAAAVGVLLVAGRFEADTARGFFALGTIALCLGAGFVASAGASIALSRRLGLWAPPPAGDDGGAADERSGLVG